MTKLDPTWETKDGRVLKIKDMDDKHLLNTINFLRRNAEVYRFKMLQSMDRYLDDGAYDACSSEANTLMEMESVDCILSYCIPSWDNLITEIKERGLGVFVDFYTTTDLDDDLNDLKSAFESYDGDWK